MKVVPGTKFCCKKIGLGTGTKDELKKAEE
jgi:hypothetical protein